VVAAINRNVYQAQLEILPVFVTWATVPYSQA